MTIGKLSIQLTGSTGGFEAAMKSASKSLGRSVKDMRKSINSVQGFAATFAGVAGALGVGALVKSSLDSIDALGDQAAAIGVSTAALSRLQYAASFAGVSTEQLNNSLGLMLNNLAAASTGTGPAAAAFKSLGLNVAELSKLPADQQFAKIADAMQGIENPAQRVSLAMDIFGKSGRALIPVLAGGSEALNKFYLEADRLGITITDIDAARVSQAADALDRAKFALTGAANQATIALAPAIQTAADRFVAFWGGTENASAAIEAFVRRSSINLAWVGDQIVRVGEIIGAGLRIPVMAGGVVVISTIDHIGRAVVGLLNLLPGMDLQWTDTFSKMADTLAKTLGNEVEKAGAAWNTLGTDGPATEAVKGFWSEAARNIKDAVPPVNKVSQGLEDAGKEAKKTTDAVGEMLDKLNTEIMQFGMTDIEKALADAANAGASPEQLEQMREMLTLLEEMRRVKEENEDLDKEAARIREDNISAEEKFAKRVDQLNTLLETGRINEREYWAEFDKAFMDSLDDPAASMPSGPGGPNGPTLIEANSVSGRAALAALESRRTADPVREQVKEQKKGNTILAAIARNTGQPALNLATIN